MRTRKNTPESGKNVKLWDLFRKSLENEYIGNDVAGCEKREFCVPLGMRYTISKMQHRKKSVQRRIVDISTLFSNIIQKRNSQRIIFGT